jgi:glycosyltransferase involved in cell wall biosynthesis
VTHVLRTVSRKVHAWRVGRRSDVVIKTDGAGWVLDDYAAHIAGELDGRLRVGLVTDIAGRTRRNVVHVVDGSCFTNPRWRSSADLWHRVIGTWWHGAPDSMLSGVREGALHLAEVGRLLAYVHVACGITREIVRQAGVPEDRIALLPLGLNRQRFYPPSVADRAAARQALGLSDDVKAVGLFQKDGDGWGAGLQPKLIKGPDIFVTVMTRLAQHHPVHAVVPGPARGFVVRSLGEAGVPCSNPGFVSAENLVRYYHACDLYLVPGREEGGPAAVLEALATATPLVAHRVGMAPDVIEDGRNGFLADIGDVDGLTEKADRVLRSGALRERLQTEGLRTVREYFWDVVGPRYEALYRRVLGKGARR